MKNNNSSIDTQYWIPSDNIIVIRADKCVIKYLETEIIEGRL